MEIEIQIPEYGATPRGYLWLILASWGGNHHPASFVTPFSHGIPRRNDLALHVPVGIPNVLVPHRQPLPPDTGLLQPEGLWGYGGTGMGVE